MLLKWLEHKLEQILSNEIESDDVRKKIRWAYEFAKYSHWSQMRKSGDLYITHPLSVAISLWEKYKDVDLMIAGFLHDVVEDCENVNIEDIYKEYGDNVGFMVDSVTKTSKSFFNDDKVFDDERDKMLYGWMKNIWCILLKLADREHNLETLSHMPAYKQVKKSFESQALYLPLMNIVWFNEENNSVLSAEQKLKKYLEDNNIKNFKEFKKHLFNICFHDFSENIFDVVYNNADRVLWVINDENWFLSLVKSWFFKKDSAEFIEITADNLWNFSVTFRIISWNTFDIKKWKLAIKNILFNN